MMWTLVVLLLASCVNEGVEHAHLGLPELGSARTVILAANEENERGLRLVAAERNAKIEVPISDGATLHLLAYEEGIDELGLSAGAIEPSRCRVDCVRLEPELVFTAAGSVDALEWAPTELPQNLRERLIETPQLTCGPCRAFDQEVLILPGSVGPRFAVSDGDDVLVGVYSGHLARIRPGGSIVEECRLPAPIRSGARLESDGSLVIGVEDGRILRISEIAGEVCPIEELGSVGAMPIRLAVAASGPLFIYVLGESEGVVSFWRVGEGASVNLHQHTVGEEFVRSYQRGMRGGVAWLGPDHVLFVVGDNGVYRLRGGEVSTETLELGDIYRVQSITVSPLGPVVGVHPWGVAVYDGTWRTTHPDPTWCDISVLLPYEDVVLLGQDGTLETFHPQTEEYCPRYTYELPQRFPQSMARLGATEVIIADADPEELSPPRVRRLFRKDDLCR